MTVLITILAGWLVLAALVTVAFTAVARGGQREERKARRERHLTHTH